MLLADLGAEVIKVESPGGDDTRTWRAAGHRDGVSTYYLSVNRNKRSVALDLRDPRRPGAGAANSRAAPTSSCRTSSPAAWPASASTTTLGPRRQPGHRLRLDQRFRQPAGGADLPGYDLIVQAMSGLMSLTGDPDGPPYRAGISVFDVMAGLHTAIAILAALHHRYDDRPRPARRGQPAGLGAVRAW